ncbi:MAG: hypothetical protein WC073_11705, partial [Sterolibacterium sp.]
RPLRQASSKHGIFRPFCSSTHVLPIFWVLHEGGVMDRRTADIAVSQAQPENFLPSCRVHGGLHAI